MKLSRLFVMLTIVILATGCAQPFNRPDESSEKLTQPDGNQLFATTARTHGGDFLPQLNDVNVGLSGKWPFLIRRIQPLVTDYRYRIDSQERLLLDGGIYTALYEGPAGLKKVVRSSDSIRVFYNGVESFDDNVLKSSAMTADAFYMFLLGPLSLIDRGGNFVRLTDATEINNRYYRIYAVLEPGFGYSERDEIIIWIDQKTNLTYRINITLEGYPSTKGAHVDVTYLKFTDKNGFKLPVEFRERVLGPIKIRAHDWKLTGLDVNRGLTINAVNDAKWSGKAQPDADVFP